MAVPCSYSRATSGPMPGHHTANERPGDALLFVPVTGLQQRAVPSGVVIGEFEGLPGVKVLNSTRDCADLPSSELID